MGNEQEDHPVTHAGNSAALTAAMIWTGFGAKPVWMWIPGQARNDEIHMFSRRTIVDITRVYQCLLARFQR